MLKKSLLLFAFILIFANCLAYTIEGDSVFIEDSQASLRVTPHTATSPTNKFKQEFEVCNKTGTTTNLYAGYIFDKALSSGKAEYWQKPVYGWVGHDYNCLYDFNYIIGQDADYNPNYAWCYRKIDVNGTDENVIIFEHEFKQGFISTKSIRYYTNQMISGNSWLDVTTSFQNNHTTLPSGKHIYPYIDGLNISGNSCETWKMEYTPDASDDTGKWDLWLWAGSNWNCIQTNTCLKTLKLDPWWNGDWESKYAITDLVLVKDMNYTNMIKLSGVNFSALNIYCSDANDFTIVNETTQTELTAVGFDNWDGTNTDTNVAVLFKPLTDLSAGTYDDYYIYTNNNGCIKPSNRTDYTSSFDTFEDNDYTTKPKWYSFSGSGTANVLAAAAKNGTYGFRISTDPTYLYFRTHFDDAEAIDFRTWVRVTDTAPRTLIAILQEGGDPMLDFKINTGKFQYSDGGVYYDFTTTPLANTWYMMRAVYDKLASNVDFYVYNASGVLLESHLNNDPIYTATIVNIIHILPYGGAYTLDFDDTSFDIAHSSAYGIGSEETQNTPPAMTSIDLNVAYSKENGDIKATASGVADTESDALTLLCGTTSIPTTDTNNFCTAFNVASPYTDVSCVGKGASGDGSKTIYCRMYDGKAYSIDQNTDTYIADNTAPSVSSVLINKGNNLEGINYDLNMAITESGSGIATATYKCWSTSSSEETCTSNSWDCKTGSLIDHGSNNYGAEIIGSVKDTSGTWTCKGYATDNVGLQGTGTDTESMNETTGFVIDSSSLSYSGSAGSTCNAAATNQTNPYILITHNGNVDLNVLNLCNALTYSSYSIAKENHKWKLTDSCGEATACSGLNQILDETWGKGTYPTNAAMNLYYWLDIPEGQQIGSYTGTITIGATKSG